MVGHQFSLKLCTSYVVDSLFVVALIVLNLVCLFLMRLFLVLVRLCRSLCHYLVLQSSFCGGELVVLIHCSHMGLCTSSW